MKILYKKNIMIIPLMILFINMSCSEQSRKGSISSCGSDLIYPGELTECYEGHGNHHIDQITFQWEEVVDMNALAGRKDLSVLEMSYDSLSLIPQQAEVNYSIYRLIFVTCDSSITFQFKAPTDAVGETEDGQWTDENDDYRTNAYVEIRTYDIGESQSNCPSDIIMMARDSLDNPGVPTLSTHGGCEGVEIQMISRYDNMIQGRRFVGKIPNGETCLVSPRELGIYVPPQPIPNKIFIEEYRFDFISYPPLRND